jgi:Asp/Glu/hydantoin racemase
MSQPVPRIALIHATPVAIDPIHAAMQVGWPEAEVVNLLDDSLAIDRARTASLSEALFQRINHLADHATEAGAAGILFTCSAFGEAIEAANARLGVPVLKPNEAMFEAALALGGNIAMIYTFAAAREGMEQEFRDQSAEYPQARLTSFLAPGAIEAIRAGDADLHNRLVAEVAANLTGFDAILLAHFSTSRAAQAARKVTSIPVLTSPDAAVAKLRALVAANAQSKG